MILDDKTKPSFENLDLKTLKIAVITSKFNENITEALREGALNTFLEEGGESKQLDFFWVPGAFELPLVAKKVANTKQYDAVLCLGAIIKGDTAHFEYVASASIHGLNQVSIESEIPILCGVLTTHNLEQASDRACTKLNIGKECMLSALSMIQTLREI